MLLENSITFLKGSFTQFDLIWVIREASESVAVDKIDGRLIRENLRDNILLNGVPFFCAFKREILTPRRACFELKTCAIANLITVLLCIIAATYDVSWEESFSRLGLPLSLGYSSSIISSLVMALRESRKQAAILPNCVKLHIFRTKLILHVLYRPKRNYGRFLYSKQNVNRASRLRPAAATHCVETSDQNIPRVTYAHLFINPI